MSKKKHHAKPWDFRYTAEFTEPGRPSSRCLITVNDTLTMKVIPPRRPIYAEAYEHIQTIASICG